MSLCFPYALSIDHEYVVVHQSLCKESIFQSSGNSLKRSTPATSFLTHPKTNQAIYLHLVAKAKIKLKNQTEDQLDKMFYADHTMYYKVSGHTLG